MAFFIAVYTSGNHFQSQSIGWEIWFAAPVLVASLAVGRMLARWAPGRELAVCVVYAVLVLIYDLVPALGDNGASTALLSILLVAAPGRRGADVAGWRQARVAGADGTVNGHRHGVRRYGAHFQNDGHGVSSGGNCEIRTLTW